MLNVQNTLTYPNLYWGTCESAVLDAAAGAIAAGTRLASPPMGQFAFAAERGGDWHLVRDRLGINKLFYSLDHETKTLRAGSSFYALARDTGDAAAIRAVPPGHVVRVNRDTLAVQKNCYYDVSSVSPGSEQAFDEDSFRRAVRRRLDAAFVSLRERFANAQFVVCLSGGLDSAVIASFAKRHLPGVTAATFSYTGRDGAPSEDFAAASRISEALGIEFLPVFAERTIDRDAVKELLAVCQDWRDFNVHCAWVNDIIARHLRGHVTPGKTMVLLTGDLMNEYVADYEPVIYRGAEYYPQPRMNRDRRRRAFVSGLDTSDREIGVFHRHGLTAVQPFSVSAEEYSSVPAGLLERPDCKPMLNLPLLQNPAIEALVVKTKVRAQVGGTDGGVLGLFHDAGITQAVLKDLWGDLCGKYWRGEDPASLMVAGRYRS